MKDSYYFPNIAFEFHHVVTITIYFVMSLPLLEVYEQLYEDIHHRILEHQPNYPPVHKHDTYTLKINKHK